MGIPLFFKWLTDNFNRAITDCVQGDRYEPTRPNRNGIEFDNLYLDFNGLVHNAYHPNDGTMCDSFSEFFTRLTYILDEIFDIVRPRNLLYIAIDGVPPFSKINQQRSRRFRSVHHKSPRGGSDEPPKKELTRISRNNILDLKGEVWAYEYDFKETMEKYKDTDEIMITDWNVITPGTRFMQLLTEHLRYHIAKKIETDPAWGRIKIILSDSSIPGEGEHKIMEYIRRQRLEKNYNPNLKHVIYGLDADLIMLALATHEVHFTILREMVFYRDRHRENYRPNGWKAAPWENPSNVPQRRQGNKRLKPYIFVHPSVIREYLFERITKGMKVEFEFDRVLDDLVFLFFLVGNDFLPHMASLEIRNDALFYIIDLYKASILSRGMYLTERSRIIFPSLREFFRVYSMEEDNIFKKYGVSSGKVSSRRDYIRRLNQEYAEDSLEFIDSEMNVLLPEEGGRKRYYQIKFGSDEPSVIKKIVHSYIEGLQWVMTYYYMGCKDWNWFYPYFYAPLGSDIFEMMPDSIEQVPRPPISPLEQLISCLPVESSHALPQICQFIMLYKDWDDHEKTLKVMNDMAEESVGRRPFVEENIPVLRRVYEYYPSRFQIDMNGMDKEYKGVAILPWVDIKVIHEAIQTVSVAFTKEENARNKHGVDTLFCSQNVFGEILNKAEEDDNLVLSARFNIFGKLTRNKDFPLPGKTLPAPSRLEAEPLKISQTVCYDFRFIDVGNRNIIIGLLPGIKPPRRVLEGSTGKNSSKRERRAPRHRQAPERQGERIKTKRPAVNIIPGPGSAPYIPPVFMGAPQAWAPRGSVPPAPQQSSGGMPFFRPGFQPQAGPPPFMMPPFQGPPNQQGIGNNSGRGPQGGDGKKKQTFNYL